MSFGGFGARKCAQSHRSTRHDLQTRVSVPCMARDCVLVHTLRAPE